MFKCFCDKCGKEVNNDTSLGKCLLEIHAYGVMKAELQDEIPRDEYRYDLCKECAILVHRYIVNSRKEDNE